CCVVLCCVVLCCVVLCCVVCYPLPANCAFLYSLVGFSCLMVASAACLNSGFKFDSPESRFSLSLRRCSFEKQPNRHRVCQRNNNLTQGWRYLAFRGVCVGQNILLHCESNYVTQHPSQVATQRIKHYLTAVTRTQMMTNSVLEIRVHLLVFDFRFP